MNTRERLHGKRQGNPYRRQEGLRPAAQRVHPSRVYLVSGPYGEEAVGHEIFRTLKVRGDRTLEDLHRAVSVAPSGVKRPVLSVIKMDPERSEGIHYTCGAAHVKGQIARPGEAREVGLAPMATIESLDLTDDQFFGYWFDLIEEWIHLMPI